MRTRQPGRVPAARAVSRREALARIGTGGVLLCSGLTPAVARAAGAYPICSVRPEQTEGPYFVEAALDRSDIRSDPGTGEVKAGVPLRLVFNLARATATSCAPLAGAEVHLWHCDAAGRYSDVRGSGTAGQRFLRGYQHTDAAGSAQFLTIFPGWYGGRAVHLHFKVRTQAAASSDAFTSQLYFDQALLEEVFAREPYASRGRRWMRNDDDGIFRDGGTRLLLAAEPDGPGYSAVFDLGLQR